MTTRPRIKALIDDFVRSEYFASWQAERIESGGYARPGSASRDRFDRCFNAAGYGADGSTHAEHIEDMRAAFHDWLRDSRRNRWAFPYRIEAAAEEHWRELEAWHAQHGSLEQEIG